LPVGTTLLRIVCWCGLVRTSQLQLTGAEEAVASDQKSRPNPVGRRARCADRGRYRPPVHRIAEDLLRPERPSLPELRDFAHHIGVPAVWIA
jgi:hypothetical protein